MASLPKTPIEKRSQLIRLRIEYLEGARRRLSYREKWPTVMSVRHHKAQVAKAASEKKDSSSKTSPVKKESPSKTIPIIKFGTPVLTEQKFPSQPPQNSSSKTDTPSRHSFPFPVSKARDLKSFPLFPLLPAEIRLQIWELALYAPKFIEAQYCLEWHQPTFVGIRPEALLSVCLESREIALSLSMTLFPQKTSLKTKSRSWHWNNSGKVVWRPASTVPFTPETDTIFFRSLGSPLEFPSYLQNHFLYMSKIQHIAFPLNLKRVPLPRNFAWILNAMRSLKTLTLMIGCEEKSWRAGKWVELRDLEEWYVDGRARKVELGGKWDPSGYDTLYPPGYFGQMVDISKLAEMYMHSAVFESSRNAPGDIRRVAGWKDPKAVNLRIVAWKRLG
jgi:hypothetical protein